MSSRSKRSRASNSKTYPSSPPTSPADKRRKTSTSRINEFAADEKSPEGLKEAIKQDSLSETNTTKFKDAQCADDNTSTQGENLHTTVSSNPRTTFKAANYTTTSYYGNRKKTWKNLKQIIAMERSLSWKPDDPTYNSIDAPCSFIPAKKYSDINGTIANYTDPQTKMRYTTTTEFKTVRNLPWDVVQGYLRLRNAATMN